MDLRYSLTAIPGARSAVLPVCADCTDRHPRRASIHPSTRHRALNTFSSRLDKRVFPVVTHACGVLVLLDTGPLCEQRQRMACTATDTCDALVSYNRLLQNYCLHVVEGTLRCASYSYLARPGTGIVAAEAEVALHNFGGGTTPKYKTKFRSLSFNLKDANNPDLRRRVLAREVAPDVWLGMMRFSLSVAVCRILQFCLLLARPLT